MSVPLSLDFNQIKSLIIEFDMNKKIELIKILEEETFPVRFKEFLGRIKTDEIDLDEITNEVELVREKRYYAREKN